jgi:hypothetical protein
VPELSRLAFDTPRSPGERIEAVGPDLTPAVVAEPVGTVLELLEGPVDLGRDMVKLAGCDGTSHLEDGVGGVVSGPLSELHLDPGRPNRLGQLVELCREVVAVCPEKGLNLISFQGDLQL